MTLNCICSHEEPPSGELCEAPASGNRESVSWREEPAVIVVALPRLGCSSGSGLRASEPDAGVGVPASNDRRRLLGQLDCSTSALEVRAHGEVDRVPFPRDLSPVRDDPRAVAASGAEPVVAT